MSFPETRHSFMQRLVVAGREADWAEFLTDYWGPVCRFAARRGSLGEADAEDVASQVFAALLGNQLLSRWAGNRSAKLRTLLCSVARNVLANRARKQAGRERLVGTQSQAGGEDFLANLSAPDDQVDAFYAAWADDLLERAVESLLTELHEEGKGDYFRVLHGRLCEHMTMPELSAALEIPVATAENYFKAARKRLAANLESLVRQHVVRYADVDLGDEFASEWGRLGVYFVAHGGLDEAIRAAYEGLELAHRQERKTASIKLALTRISPSGSSSEVGGNKLPG
jgi:RNA polymerase sigma factor (sigma-70 family)